MLQIRKNWVRNLKKQSNCDKRGEKGGVVEVSNEGTKQLKKLKRRIP
jgi:hypothetical protein